MVAGASPYSVLIVEDNQDSVLGLQNVLHHDGYTVTVASTDAAFDHCVGDRTAPSNGVSGRVKLFEITTEKLCVYWGRSVPQTIQTREAELGMLNGTC